MKNFVVHELVDGWTCQAGSLIAAMTMRDNILRDAHMDGDSVEVMITAEVDESDLA
jgi:hypothetical protein